MLGIQGIQIDCSCIHPVAGVVCCKAVRIIGLTDGLIHRFFTKVIINGADGNFQHIQFLTVNGFLENLAAGRNTFRGETLAEFCNFITDSVSIQI